MRRKVGDDDCFELFSRWTLFIGGPHGFKKMDDVFDLIFKLHRILITQRFQVSSFPLYGRQAVKTRWQSGRAVRSKTEKVGNGTLKRCQTIVGRANQELQSCAMILVAENLVCPAQEFFGKNCSHVFSDRCQQIIWRHPTNGLSGFAGKARPQPNRRFYGCFALNT